MPLFEPHRQNACCLCGAVGNLTGEHKIKASALRGEFSLGDLVIGRFGDSETPMRLVKSVKSKKLHFAARICAPCNNSRTQAADLEFQHFHELSSVLQASGIDPISAFDDPRYVVGSDAYLNIFRYFAKLLCCHMADFGAPRPVYLSRFAVGEVNDNCVWVQVDKDWMFTQLSAEFNISQYAAHGGLIINANKETSIADGAHSALTIGPLRYVFYSQFTVDEQLELQFQHQDFTARFQELVKTAIASPMTSFDRLRLGLPADETDES